MRKINSHLRFAGDKPAGNTDRQAYNIYVQGARAFENKDFAAAVGFLTTATSLNPAIEKGWMFLAFSHFMLENYEDCETAVDNCLKIADNPFMVHLKGKLMLINRKYSAAEKYFRRAWELAPDELEFIHDLAEYLYAIGKYEDAALYYPAILKTPYADLHMQLSYIHCLLRTGDETAAELTVKLIIEHAESLMVRDEIIRFIMGTPESYVIKDRLCDKMLAVNIDKFGDNPLIHLVCGILYTKIDNPPGAVKALAEYIGNNEEASTEVLHMLANICMKKENRGRAKEILAAAIEKWEKSVPIMVQLGLIMAEDGDFTASEEIMDRARKISPRSKVIRNAEKQIQKKQQPE